MNSALSQNFAKLPPTWKQKLQGIQNEPFFKTLDHFLDEEELGNKSIYPEPHNIFRALQELDLPAVKVVILGQDPYHGPNQAIGFSFAVPNDLKKKPPSLKNIFKELKSDLNIEVEGGQSDLTGWVAQGMLLLNTVLTVESGKPLSHRGRGWEQFTDRVIDELDARAEPMVFVLWGAHAQKLKSKINVKRHVVIESAHPSPLSAYRGFFGSKVFSRINEALVKMNYDAIDWAKRSTKK
jgi:uracil-DNA glycosylase